MAVSRLGRGRLRACWFVCALCACTGEIATERGDSNAPGLGGAGTATGSGEPSNPPGAGGASSGAGGAGAAELPAPSTRAARLTHTQWENSVRDLFYLDSATAFATSLRSDPVQSGFIFDNNSLTLEVDEALWSGYQRAAAEIALHVTSDPTRLARIAPNPATGSADADARAREFVGGLGLRAHRRPLTAAEHAEYLALFALGASLYAGLDVFAAGARVVIEAMLQSPHFIYRVEAGADAAGGVIALDDHEISARLSYTLWNTMPDAELFQAAGAGALSDAGELERQVRRMLADARAEAVIERFHSQLFEAHRFDDVSPSASFYPGAPPDLGELAATEHALFVRDVAITEQGGYRDLLTSTDTFANDALAALYGLNGSFGPDFVKTALDPAQRRGILTQIGFLAVNATSVNPDPIHRGVFIARRIACMQISAPPANVPPLPEPEGRTNRQTVEAHTQVPGTLCATCHTPLINPLGFPFESYDAIGAYRTHDNGHPVDTRAQPSIGSEQVAVANAVELAEALADSADVHACYAKHWLEFAYARPDASADQPLIARLAAASQRDELPIAELLVQLVTSRAFLARSSEELP